MRPTNSRGSKYPFLFALLAAAFVWFSFRDAQGAPAPVATPEVAPSPAPTPTYDGIKQSQYIATAKGAFTAQRQAKFQGFMDARTAFETAGGISPVRLSTDTLAGRRALLAKVQAAAADYLAFTTSQEDTYRAELAKTPLTRNDIDSLVSEYSQTANTPRAIKLQELERDLLACSDDMFGLLDKASGNWRVTPSGQLLFKKKSNEAAYAALNARYNELIAAMQALQSPPPATGSLTPAGPQANP